MISVCSLLDFPKETQSKMIVLTSSQQTLIFHALQFNFQASLKVYALFKTAIISLIKRVDYELNLLNTPLISSC